VFISKFKVVNFKIHRATEVTLRPVTLFVGANNGGKSSLFDALLNFSMLSRGKVAQAFGQGPYSFRSTRHHAAGPSARVRFEVDLASDAESAPLHYTIAYGASGKDQALTYIIYDEKLVNSSGDVIFDRSSEICTLAGVQKSIRDDVSVFAALRSTTPAQSTGDFAIARSIAVDISRVNSFRLSPQNLMQACALPDVELATAPHIDHEGVGLAALLYYLERAVNQTTLQIITAYLADAVVGFERFDFNTVGQNRIAFSVQFSDSRGLVAAANLSAGTLSMIGLVALLVSTGGRSQLLLLEEPENGLTPRSMRILRRVITSASAGEHGEPSQIVLSSHSPFALSDAWNSEQQESIYVFSVVDGEATVVPLTEWLPSSGAVLRSGDEMGLKTAEEILDGRFSQG